MSLVNPKTLERVNILAQSARDSLDYKTGYHLAMEAIQVATAALEQIDFASKGFHVRLEEKF